MDIPKTNTPIKDGKESKCGTCNVMVGVKAKALWCDMCDNWYHTKCINIKDELYNSLKEWPTVSWVCDVCIRNKKSVRKKEGKIEMDLMRKMDELFKRIEENSKREQVERENIKEQLRVMTEQNISLYKRLNDIESNIEEKIDRKIELKMTDREESLIRKVKKEIDEEIDKYRREDNVVILGMQEGEDQLKIRSLMDELEIVNTEESYKWIRIGKQNQQKPRPILIKPKNRNENLKGQMLKNAKRLKNTKKEELKNIIITADQTIKEREESKKLREELRERREAGEQNLIIRGNKIVEKTPNQNRSANE